MNLNFDKPRNLTQWLIFAAAITLTLSSPAGTRAFLQELDKVIFGDARKIKKKYSFTPRDLTQALYYLKKRKIITISDKDGKSIIELTEKGRQKKLQFDLDLLRVQPPAKWDGKWRLLMFDVPERKKQAREALREKLKQLGFYRFQKSVWLFPYPCENEIDFISELFEVGQYVTLLTVNIEKDFPLRAKFQLS